jgi:hypothetical protein
VALHTLGGRYGELRQIISVAPTITAGAYALGQAVGGRMQFARASNGAGVEPITASGFIEALRVIDRSLQLAPLELWLFDQTFTAMADQATWNPSDADLDNCVGVIAVNTEHWFRANTQGVALVNEIELPYVTVGGDSLYGQLVCRGTPTFASVAAIRVRLSVRKD